MDNVENGKTCHICGHINGHHLTSCAFEALRAVFCAYEQCAGVDDYIQLTPGLTMGDVRRLIAQLS